MADGNADCLDQARAQKYLNQFTIRSEKNDDGTPVEGKFDACNPKSMSYVMVKAFMMLEDLPPLNVQSDEYDHSVMKQAPMDFYRAHIKTIQFDRADTGACNGGQAAAYVMGGEGQVMHICPNMQKSDLMFMTDVLIHEARHVDGYPHQLCNHGSWAGEDFYGCDPTYEWGGAYAIENEFNVRYARTEGLPEEQREEARALAIDGFLNNFNKAPFNLRPGVFLQKTDGQVSFYDGAKEEPLLQMTGAHDVLAARESLATVFNPTAGTVNSYYSQNASGKTDGEYAQSFRDLSASERSKFVDAIWAKRTTCMLYVDHLRCDVNGERTDMDLHQVHPAGLLNWKGSVAILDESGELYVVPTAKIGTAGFDERGLVRTANPNGVISEVAGAKNAVLDLLKDGTLWSRASKKRAPVAVLPEARYVKLLGPAYWSAEMGAF